MWRQGDVFVEAISRIPSEAEERPHLVLAEGEVTGHAHRITERSSAKLFASGSNLYLRVLAKKTAVTHEEHGTITLPRGVYRVWRQREYAPGEIRTVRD